MAPIRRPYPAGESPNCEIGGPRTGQASLNRQIGRHKADRIPGSSPRNTGTGGFAQPNVGRLSETIGAMWDKPSHGVRNFPGNPHRCNLEYNKWAARIMSSLLSVSGLPDRGIVVGRSRSLELLAGDLAPEQAGNRQHGGVSAHDN